jgi:tripartite-type tricarboxylate transporter receptor subunit TctC
VTTPFKKRSAPPHSALNSAPDGYTIAFVGPNYAINPALYEKLPFDFIRDSVPVAGIMRLANVMDVNPTFPADNLAEFIAYAKAIRARSTSNAPHHPERDPSAGAGYPQSLARPAAT